MRAFEIANKIIAGHREIEKCFREEIAMIEKRLQTAQNDHRDLLIRFMRVRGNFNLRGAIEWVRERKLCHYSTATNVQNKSSESTTPYASPSNKRLVQLMENTTFSENLLKICEINKMTGSRANMHCWVISSIIKVGTWIRQTRDCN
ncbi:hypothetical protein Glove_330g120 [Diversispora epigaea]|uniref:Uncharacterized protein n=1 Tax=Diversispora epigaea TaxID=1348612 RepID=A0A397HJY4_9GLOM|nr:hypothetical protein Glove_330g120 [Diversispora epigaea]